MSPTVLAIAPDGSSIVVVGIQGETSHLYKRPLGGDRFKKIEGSENAISPFFSDDGDLAFSTGTQMRRMPGAGNDASASTFICKMIWFVGASWRGETFLFNKAPANGLGLERLDTLGEAPTPFTTPDPAQGELNHFWPQILPGGKAFIYSARTSDLQNSRIMVKSFNGGEPKPLVQAAAYAKYASSGHLVYSKRGSLWAQQFNLQRLELEGEEKEVFTDLWINPWFKTETWDISETDGGTLVYMAKPKQPVG